MRQEYTRVQADSGPSSGIPPDPKKTQLQVTMFLMIEGKTDPYMGSMNLKNRRKTALPLLERKQKSIFPFRYIDSLCSVLHIGMSMLMRLMRGPVPMFMILRSAILLPLCIRICLCLTRV
jgi:hypothetical protein